MVGKFTVCDAASYFVVRYRFFPSSKTTSAYSGLSKVTVFGLLPGQLL